MDRPSAHLAIKNFGEGMSDASSLTEPAHSPMDVDGDLANSPDSDISPFRGRLGRFGTPSRFFHNADSSISLMTHRESGVASNTRFSQLETLPVELLEQVAIYLTDSDLSCISLASKALCVKLIPKNSGIWRTRFLSLYDFPGVEGPCDFRAGYQLRRFVLRNFADCGAGGPTAEVGMEVLRDMVLVSCLRRRLWLAVLKLLPAYSILRSITDPSGWTETYNRPKAWLPAPTHSRNLAAFSVLSTSPWMKKFLLCSFFNWKNEKAMYGEPNELFDALQVVLSHLVLNPLSPFALQIPTSRGDYDIAKVYLWNRPLQPIFTRAPKPETPTQANLAPSTILFPKLSSRSPQPDPEIRLDLHSVLHIRNFWRRQFTANDEVTYYNMAEALVRIGRAPRKWERALQEPLALKMDWVGHYSCLHKWPKKMEDFEDKQSCVEDWPGDGIDPLTLDFSTTTNNTSGPQAGYWPPIFSTIPVFASNTPQHSSAPHTYLRGVAPHLDISSPPATDPDQRSKPAGQKYHPFLGLRLRGLIHSISTPVAAATSDNGFAGWELDTGIPGFHRIIMVLYQPTTRSLVSIWEHTCEEFGDVFQQTISGQTIQNIDNDGAGLTATGGGLDAEAYEKRCKEKLRRDLGRAEWQQGPLKMGREWVEMVEDRYSEAKDLNWDDIDYAYAYEGIIIPGGKIMMGRWWMVGAGGEGDGRELGGPLKGERGPWVFWC